MINQNQNKKKKGKVDFHLGRLAGQNTQNLQIRSALIGKKIKQKAIQDKASTVLFIKESIATRFGTMRKWIEILPSKIIPVTPQKER